MAYRRETSMDYSENRRSRLELTTKLSVGAIVMVVVVVVAAILGAG